MANQIGAEAFLKIPRHEWALPAALGETVVITRAGFPVEKRRVLVRIVALFFDLFFLLLFVELIRHKIGRWRILIVWVTGGPDEDRSGQELV